MIGAAGAQFAWWPRIQASSSGSTLAARRSRVAESRLSFHQGCTQDRDVGRLIQRREEPDHPTTGMLDTAMRSLGASIATGETRIELV